MKVKHLQSILENVEPFKNPKIKLEQYSTSAHISANILHKIYTDFDEDFESLSVLDLGSGSGVFSIGASALGAPFVVGVDIDEQAIRDATGNIEVVFEGDNSSIELIQADICDDRFFERFEKRFDVVVMNPPFGTKGNKGIDIQFLQRALQLSTSGVYSLHKSSTREFIEKKFRKLGINVTILNELRYDIPASYKCHKRSTQDIAVDFIRFTFD